ncbi:ATP-binding cassette domain-containing protein [Thiotrichales bacterium 19S9-12]|nr:ATP-binding cassette domain-containing protein [Thiotrichales bacterium 19S9-11]MCF6810860.1 ATP-binding cassette domain-containing protein [Thiotrichales bacterium 19S9-12]
MSDALLDVQNLSVNFKTQDGLICAVNHINFQLYEGETLGIVGESGSGKSQTVLALMGILANNAKVQGSIKFNQQELIGLNKHQFNQIRGNEIAMIFQDPMSSLNPYLKIEEQLTEVLKLHKGISKKEAYQQSLDMLDAVHIPDAKNRIKLYPHEFSGGMRQRVMIAMALLCKPKLLIADEPTTALDVTVQAQILDLLRQLQKEFQMATIFITHDIGVVAGICNRVMVMYAGSLIESAQVNELFNNFKHPYTEGLMKATPRVDVKKPSLYAIDGEPPDLSNLPVGCAFSSRCNYVKAHCLEKKPSLEMINHHHKAACFIQLQERL